MARDPPIGESRLQLNNVRAAVAVKRFLLGITLAAARTTYFR